jgi:hypothetical protein
VNQRHLLPDEIDQFLDDEVGFGSAPLKAHIADCPECRGKLDDARAVTGIVERLPRLAPSHRFTERVMSQVPVFVPWHVAAREWIAEMVPAAGRSRKAAIAAAALMAVGLGIITIALLTQSDLILLASNVAVDRMREIAVAGVGGLVVNLFGEQTFNAVAQYGTMGFALAALAMIAALAGTFASLRAFAASASRRRG